MFLKDLQKRLKGRRKSKERVNEEEEEKAKIFKSTYNILDVYYKILAFSSSISFNLSPLLVLLFSLFLKSLRNIKII